jgi:alpha-D-ribose 1-methylphosphonate 5-phosphate C-P lyase
VTVAALAAPAGTGEFGHLDEQSKREIRCALLTAVAVPGYQVPFASREMPVARGWGSGGLQVTLAVVGPQDTVKVIDQGDDAGVNAANLRRLIVGCTGIPDTTDAREASIIQTRHRIPEEPLRPDQVLVLQVPVPEPLRGVERDMRELRRMHAESDYSRIWVSLYEDLVRNGVITQSTGYPVLVGGRYVMATSPIPRWDVPRLHQAPFLSLFGAGREKRVYAVPPHTSVQPLAFEDVAFQVERTEGASCLLCGAAEAYLVEVPASRGWICSDTDWCERRRPPGGEAGETGRPGAELAGAGGNAREVADA